jgi:hypothetical protein
VILAYTAIAGIVSWATLTGPHRIGPEHALDQERFYGTGAATARVARLASG